MACYINATGGNLPQEKFSSLGDRQDDDGTHFSLREPTADQAKLHISSWKAVL